MQDSLCDETSPDISHPETAHGRQIEQGKRLTEKGRVLAVERAPCVLGEKNRGMALVEADRKLKQHPVNRIDIRIVIREALLNRTCTEHHGLWLGRRGSRVLQWKPAGIHEFSGEVSINVDPFSR